ncbi:MAG: hypothetical protein QM756_36195 [Polyangiaceae bacterium]
MSATTTSDNVFGWLDNIQQRPGMYLGATTKPLDDLQTLVRGYIAALSVHGLVEGVPSMSHFSTWLHHKTRWSTSCGWADAIATHSNHDSALATFFELIAEFRKLRPRTLSIARLSEHHRPNGVREKIGFDGRIDRPDRVDVVQYAPSSLHFLRFHYGQRLVDQHLLYTSDGSHSTNIDFAKRWVLDEFSLQLGDWQDQLGS